MLYTDNKNFNYFFLQLIDGERDEQELAQNVAVSYLMNLREFHKTTEVQ